MPPKLPLLLLLITLLLSLPSHAQPIIHQPHPDTLTDLRPYFWNNLPASTGYVNDYEDLFTDQEVHMLDSLIRNFEQRSTIEIAVITFDTLMVARDSLDALTLRLANFWGVGKKETNNGVTIGISKGYRRIRIQNGYGIEAILTDEETKQILDTNFIPYYKKDQFFEGTYYGLIALMDIMQQRFK